MVIHSSLYPYSTFGCRNVAQALQNITMLPLYCRLHCNIPATSWKHCRAILQWPRLCNVSGILRTHCRAILQCPRLCNISGNIAHTLPCNIAMSTFVQYFRNIAHTLPCNIAKATFVQRLSNESEINPEFRVAIPNCRHAEFSLRFHRLTPSEYMRTWTIS